jgi:predicted polyphosphate/ATP-dependent NAD kinase
MKTMKKIGLIVNPVAGMGGSVGLKGTDKEMYKKALEMNAKPVTPGRTKEFLSYIKNIENITFFTAPDKMGENYLREFNIKFKVVGFIGGEISAEDTKKIAKDMVKKIDLLVFVGGDGTARDIYDAVGLKKPVVAVPSGVKMFSSVFAVNPRAAAEMVDSFIKGTDLKEEEVLDIDEDAFRNNKLSATLYGYLNVPYVKRLLQSGKEASRTDKHTMEDKEGIARHIIEERDDEILYLLGPGTTLKAIADMLKLPKTLLGIDAVFKGKIVGKDLNEEGILKLLKEYKKVKIVITPIGGNGFIFGRGNKQFTTNVLKKIGKENIIVVGTERKLRRLTCLRVDTGSLEVDKILQGYIKVVTGYREEVMIEVRC